MRNTTVLPGTPCPTPRAGEPPLHRLEVAGPGAVPFVAGSFEEVGPLSRTNHPHRHTFYEIVHVTAGSGTHVVDLARWPVRPPHLTVILPGQIHHWQDDRGLDGTLALFTEDFLVGHPDDRRLLRRLGRACWFALDAEADARTARLMADLVTERRERAPGYESVLRALLHVLVVQAARLPVAAGGGAGDRRGVADDAGDPSEGSGPLAEAFARLVARPEAPAWTVRECAGRLGVTPGHLTQAVRAATGRSPGRLLIEARVYQAQRLLAHTDLPVRQVAARVGCADPAYFCRFFRRETGTSPGDFRKHHSRRHQSIEAPETRA
ncbi:AraC family transcriptional regulator [Streptomyces lucensis JCM 4490]|uniref:AraC family transcriptional regulator n=1 Tax=Streptomyces lucensis JCM 4490 TaxID=1306176 RepID=A0A918JE79_9ACTN|nr:AraC family transcriptional regulator [Streptomyces lucensis]GGW76446.1 AraC family transcriptional regulator [Streptomyces lucensis JCM 4490]